MGIDLDANTVGFFAIINLVAILVSISVGHRGGYEAQGLLPTCGRAWATVVKWLILLTVLFIGVLTVFYFVSEGKVDNLEYMVPGGAIAITFLALFLLPATVITAFIAYNFGGQKRAREELSRDPPVPAPLPSAGEPSDPC